MPTLVLVALALAFSAQLRDLRVSLVVGISYLVVSLVVSCLTAGPRSVPAGRRWRAYLGGPLVILVAGGVMGLILFGLSHLFR